MYDFNEKESRYLRSRIWARLCDLKTEILKWEEELEKSTVNLLPGAESHYQRIVDRDIGEFNLANKILKELSKNRATINPFPWSPEEVK